MLMLHAEFSTSVVELLLLVLAVISCGNPTSFTMQPHYFLLYCDEDESHAVVPAEDVVFKGIPNKGETVPFYYDSSSRSYKGRVIEIGDDDASFVSLVKLQNSLNSKSRQLKANSFDATKPRKASIKQKEDMKRLFPKRKNTSEKPVAPAKKHQASKKKPYQSVPIFESSDDDEELIALVKKHSEEGAINEEEGTNSGKEDAEVREESDDEKDGVKEADLRASSSDSDAGEKADDPELFGIKKQIPQNSKRNDVAALKTLARDSKKPAGKGSSGSGPPSTSGRAKSASPGRTNKKDSSPGRTNKNDSSSGCTNISDSSPGRTNISYSSPGRLNRSDLSPAGRTSNALHQNPNGETSLLEDSRTSEQASVRALCKRRRRPRTSKEGTDVVRKEFKGKMFHYDKADPDKNIIELYEGSMIFIHKADLSGVRKKATTATQVARGLMDAIFTTEALLNCSLQGELSTAGGPSKYQQRTALDKAAVDVIQDYALKFAKAKNFNKQHSLAEVKQSMRCKLTELSYAYRENSKHQGTPAAN